MGYQNFAGIGVGFGDVDFEAGVRFAVVTEEDDVYGFEEWM